MRKSRWTLGLSLLLPFALVLAAMFADLSPVHSAPPPDKTFAVNDNSDVIDANPADGNCISLEATCTLRAAIQQANALYASSGARTRSRCRRRLIASPSAAPAKITPRRATSISNAI